MPEHIKDAADRFSRGEHVFGFELELVASWFAGWRVVFVH